MLHEPRGSRNGSRSPCHPLLLLAAVAWAAGCGGIGEPPFTVPSEASGGSGGTVVTSVGGTQGRPTGGTSGLGGSSVGNGGGSGSGGSGMDGGGFGGTTSGPPTSLVGAPLSFSPTAQGFGLSAVAAGGDPSLLVARVRVAGTELWRDPTPATVRGTDVAEWWWSGLAPGIRYEYQVLSSDGVSPTVLYTGSTITQRQPGDSFTFALVTDSHIGANLSYTNQGDPVVLSAVSAEARAAAPDFLLHLGDMLDFHQYGFNDAPPDSSVSRSAYLNYRTLLGDTIGHAAHFLTIGNWEGEDGTYAAEETERSRSQRLLYLPGPSPFTYPESGSPSQDYYAFTWGDALFIVLNVMSYTPTAHLLSADPGLPDDWTLGAAQMAWLETTLANATSKWRFLCIHHAVGGAAGDEYNAAYGRGGGQAAYVGEQAKVHQLMLQYGVQIFFYGHDHVFTDIVVDGIHYTLPGNAGAIWMFGSYETGYAQSWLEHGWGRVTVGPQQVHVQLIKLGGELLYEYTLP
jgi:hypothetical protein